MALALWSMTVIVAPIFGPILGGYISDNYHWGWIFFINIPIGLFVILIAMSTLKGRETKTEIKPIDTVGLVLLVVGIGALQIMLDQGKELDWFNSTEIIVLTVVAVVALVFLVVWELTDDHPGGGFVAVQIAQLYHRLSVYQPGLHAVFRGDRAVATVATGGIWLHRHLGRLGVCADRVAAGDLVTDYRPASVTGWIWRRLVTFSFIMYAVCFYWRAYTFEPGMDFGASAWPQFFQGFAIACFFMPLTTITLSGLPPERIAAASSLSNFTRTLAGSIGTSITTTLWTSREAMHHSHLTEFVNPFNPQSQEMYSKLEQLGMSKQQASAYIANEITAQGLIISANEIFWLSAGVFLILLALVWFAKPPFSSGGGGGGAH
ncbi:Multidrug resistance protein B [Serratia fonticola]|uniref:Multidrug resistance protein B n=1 Tax=Serratia fonticola TaxID=47917 RepID=A0A4U9U5H6_SERFO|nr:Multidrug resistance protein B [Serratia fonticola]